MDSAADGVAVGVVALLTDALPVAALAKGGSGDDPAAIVEGGNGWSVLVVGRFRVDGDFAACRQVWRLSFLIARKTIAGTGSGTVIGAVIPVTAVARAGASSAGDGVMFAHPVERGFA